MAKRNGGDNTSAPGTHPEAGKQQGKMRKEQPASALESVKTDDGLGKGLSPEELTDEIRRNRVYWAASRIEEAGDYASSPTVQQKLRDTFGAGIHQKLVSSTLATRRDEMKLSASIDSKGENEEPLSNEVKCSLVNLTGQVMRLIGTARAQEQRKAEMTIRKIEDEAREEIAHIDKEMSNLTEEVIRLTDCNERLETEVASLKATVAQQKALLETKAIVPDMLQEQLSAIMAAVAAKGAGDPADTPASKPSPAKPKSFGSKVKDAGKKSNGTKTSDGKSTK